jgi:hypothetical protein
LARAHIYELDPPGFEAQPLQGASLVKKNTLGARAHGPWVRFSKV